MRRDGSRYCPQCLAARNGRWMLSWRLPWSFACTVHGTVLLDDCPACGRAPRRNLSWAGLNPAGTCPAPAGEGKRCEASLHAVPAERAESALLAAQQWISTLTASAASDHGEAARALGDLPVIAGWLLRHAAAGEITALGAQAGPAWQSWLAQRQPARDVRRPAPCSPASPRPWPCPSSGPATPQPSARSAPGCPQGTTSAAPGPRR